MSEDVLNNNAIPTKRKRMRISEMRSSNTPVKEVGGKKLTLKKDVDSNKPKYGVEKNETLNLMISEITEFSEAFLKNDARTDVDLFNKKMKIMTERLFFYDQNLSFSISSKLKSFKDSGNVYDFLDLKDKVSKEYDSSNSRKLHEVINNIYNTKDDDKALDKIADLKEFLQSKDDAFLYSVAEKYNHRYQERMTKENFEKRNIFFAALNTRVEISERVKAPYHLRKAVRDVYEGGFNVNDELNNEYDNYSKIYKKYIIGEKARQIVEPEHYDVDKCKGWSTYKNVGMTVSDKYFKEALSNLGIAIDDIHNLNTSDISKIMSDRYGKDDVKNVLYINNLMTLEQKTVKENFYLKRILPLEAEIRKDWESKGISEKYTDYWFKSIRGELKDESGKPIPATANPPIKGKNFEGIIPICSIDHTHELQDLYMLDDINKINDVSNFRMIVEFDDNKVHDLINSVNRHFTEDGVEYVERMNSISKYDENGNPIVYISGLSAKSQIAFDKEKHKTNYRDINNQDKDR